MEILKATKVSTVGFIEIDREDLGALFESRVKVYSEFGTQYTIRRSGVEGAFDYYLSSLAGVVKHGNVLSSDGNIFLDKKEFLKEYKVVKVKETKEDE